MPNASNALHGKVAVVTGAGSGIGRALALKLGEHGVGLAISDTDEVGLNGTATLIGARSQNLFVQRLDVTDRNETHTYAGAVAVRFGLVHQLYNCAGCEPDSLGLATDERLEEHVLANYWGVVNTTDAFLPYLAFSRDGQVASLSIMSDNASGSDVTAFRASAFAVNGYVEALRAELVERDQPVQLTSVHPSRQSQSRSVPPWHDGRQEVASNTAAAIFDGVLQRQERLLVGGPTKVSGWGPTQPPLVAALHG